VLADEKGGQVTRNVRVDEKGNVALPGVDSFNCAGMTVSQLQDRLAAAADTSGNSAGRLRPIEVKKVAERPELADATKPDEVEGLVGRGMQRSRAARAPAPPAASAPNSQVRTRTAQREARDEQHLSAERTNTPAEAAEPKQEFADRGMKSAAPDGSTIATAPADEDGVATLDAGIRPAPAATSPSATAPGAGADEAGAGEKVDVVIVLRRNAVPAPAATPAPVIAAGDALNVAFGEGYENTTAVTVREDGTIELESLGTVNVAGSTPDAAARDIEALLKDKGLPADTKVTVTRKAPAEAPNEADAPQSNTEEPEEPTTDSAR
jgi:protein involved in polysaccharide export with SLBB domain